MKRREFVGLGTAAVGAMALPQLSWAASGTPTVLHIIRIQLAPTISPQMRAQLARTTNRFKQIHAPSKFIVGRDVTPEGAQHYDITQISFLEGEERFHEYFYDPIHLYADREAYDATDKPFGAVSSFDEVRGGDDALTGRLNKIMSDREAKFKANDTRPTSPPVPDRPEDQRWNYGKNIFRIVRVNLSAMSESQRAERLAAMGRLKDIKGVQQLFIGNDTHRAAEDGFTHGLLIALENEDAYHSYMTDPIHEAESRAGAKLTVKDRLIFDVIDPLDNALAERLKKFHTETGT